MSIERSGIARWMRGKWPHLAIVAAFGVVAALAVTVLTGNLSSILFRLVAVAAVGVFLVDRARDQSQRSRRGSDPAEGSMKRFVWLMTVAAAAVVVGLLLLNWND